MLSPDLHKRITTLRELAMRVVEEADEVLRTEPGSSLQGSPINYTEISQDGLTDKQKADIVRKRRMNVAKAKYKKSQ